MFRAVIDALVKSVRRDLAGYTAIKTNNFFLFVALLVWGALRAGVEPVSSYPFLLALGILMLFPASGDPLEKIPRVRLALWPMSRADRAALRVASLALSPVFWLMVVLLALRANARFALGFAAAAVAVRGVSAVTRAPRWSVRSAVPAIPGHLGCLVSNNLRQVLSVLDTWLALAIGAGGGAWRIFGPQPDPAAFPVLSLLAAVALSTCAQCGFALDEGPGMTRYHLFPLRGWQIVAAKDVAFLAVLLVAVAPLSVMPALAFGLAALAVGRYPALRLQLPQQRWRFTSGRVLWGVLQGIVGGVLGFATAENGPAPLVAAAALYAVSLWWAGRQWDLLSAPSDARRDLRLVAGRG